MTNKQMFLFDSSAYLGSIIAICCLFLPSSSRYYWKLYDLIKLDVIYPLVDLSDLIMLVNSVMFLALKFEV